MDNVITDETTNKLLHALLALAESVKPDKSSSEPLSVWLCFWFDTFKKRRIKPATAQEYERLIRSVICPQIGDIPLQRLNLADIQAFLNSIPYPNTQRKVYLLLRSALAKAALPSVGKIPFNPCQGVELLKGVPMHRRAFTFEEQVTLLSDFPERYAQLFYFLCCTGLRLGEFLALRPEDVDFQRHILIVNKSCDRYMQLGTPKTSTSNRFVYFDEKLFEVFPIALLGSFTNSAVHSQFVRTFTKCRISGVCIHSTRHTFATLCDYVGIRDKLTQAMLGHATMAMTKDTYTHLYKKGNSPILEYFERLKTTIENVIKLR
jgi:integrase